MNPTNQFSVKVSIPFPDGPEGNAVMRWFNLQNCGKEHIPLKQRIPQKVKDRAYRLHVCRQYTFVFQVTEEGEWMFVGRKDV